MLLFLRTHKRYTVVLCSLMIEKYHREKQLRFYIITSSRGKINPRSHRLARYHRFILIVHAVKYHSSW